MMELIKSLNNEGKMIIVISHDVDLCYEYADRVIIMNQGEVVCDASVEEAFSDLSILNKVSLTEPFVHKVKRILNIDNKDIRSISKLKEVIGNE